MKILLPNIITCKRIYNLLAIYYKDETNRTPFDHAMIIWAASYNIVKPRVRFRRTFGHDQCAGRCYESGFIEILYPSACRGNVQNWISIVMHEMAHYYLWSHAEEKAYEYELKMIRRMK